MQGLTLTIKLVVIVSIIEVLAALNKVDGSGIVVVETDLRSLTERYENSVFAEALPVAHVHASIRLVTSANFSRATSVLLVTRSEIDDISLAFATVSGHEADYVVRRYS